MKSCTPRTLAIGATCLALAAGVPAAGTASSDTAEPSSGSRTLAASSLPEISDLLRSTLTDHANSHGMDADVLIELNRGSEEFSNIATEIEHAFPELFVTSLAPTRPGGPSTLVLTGPPNEEILDRLGRYPGEVKIDWAPVASVADLERISGTVTHFVAERLGVRTGIGAGPAPGGMTLNVLYVPELVGRQQVEAVLPEVQKLVDDILRGTGRSVRVTITPLAGGEFTLNAPA